MKAFEESSQTVLYQLSVADVLKVAETTEHALGDLSKAETERPENKFAADVTPAYPVILLLHDLMESLGRVPSWSDFERYLFDHQDMCLRFFMEAGGIPSLQSLPKMWAGSKMRAVRWRMANFYYSFLKEVHIIVSLRRLHGLDALYHPLLDVEWKADFVCGDIRVELYFSNAKYKAATSGRKTACQKLNPGLPVIPKLVERTDRFGECWLYKDEVIAELARDIRKLGGPSIPSFMLPG